MLRALAVAAGFLTRVPIATGAVSAKDLGRAVTWFPAVGAALGAVLVGTHHLLAGRLSPGLVAVAIVAVHAGLTGGLHLDGVADVFDALGGGRGRRDRMLAIMRDSRIGAHGAVAVVLLLVAKILAVVQLVDQGSWQGAGHGAGLDAVWGHGPGDVWSHRLDALWGHGPGAIWALYAAPVAARWAVVPIVIGFPYARPDGLGKPFHGHAGPAQLAGATAIAAIAVGWLGARAISPAIGAALAALAIALWLRRHLGGLTGDVYGAAIEAAELAFLVVAGLS